MFLELASLVFMVRLSEFIKIQIKSEGRDV